MLDGMSLMPADWQGLVVDSVQRQCDMGMQSAQ